MQSPFSAAIADKPEEKGGAPAMPGGMDDF